jgi:hypothetical protein
VDHLGEMDRMNVIDRFYLYHYATFDKQVDSELAVEGLALVPNGNVALALGATVILSEFDNQAFPIDGLQQTWSEGPMHFNGVTNDSLGQSFEFSSRGSHASLDSTTRAGSFSGVVTRQASELGSICRGGGPRVVE